MRKHNTQQEGTMTSTEIYERAVTQGLERDHHESDLYLKVTTDSQALVRQYKFRANVTTFVSQIDRCLWYDIPFAYQPFWNRAAKRA